MKTVQLSDGGWLELREPSEVQVQHSRKIEALLASVQGAMVRIGNAVKVEIAKLGLDEGEEPTKDQTQAALLAAECDPPLSEDESDRMLQLEQVSLVAVIGRWSRPEPISRATFETMAMRDYRPIVGVAKSAADAAIRNIRVDFEPSRDPNVPPNPKDDIPFGGSPD